MAIPFETVFVHLNAIYTNWCNYTLDGARSIQAEA